MDFPHSGESVAIATKFRPKPKVLPNLTEIRLFGISESKTETVSAKRHGRNTFLITNH